MAGGAEASELLALLFGARRGALHEHSLPVPVLEGPGTASPGSCWAAAWPVCHGAGMDGGWLGPSLRAAVEGTGSSSSTLSSLVLLEGCGPGSGVCAGGAAAPRAAAGLPSRPAAAWEASGPGGCCTCLLHSRATCTTSRRTKLAARLCREQSSRRASAPSFRPKMRRLEMTRWSAAEAVLRSAPKSCLSSWRNQGSRGWSTAGCWRNTDAPVGTAGAGTCPAAPAWGSGALPSCAGHLTTSS